MSFIVKNPHDRVAHVGSVAIDPKQQLTFHHETPELKKALADGEVIISGSGDATKEERKADVNSYKPLKVGDPAIDGEA
jgi:heptaprenylglyceryl phosphate synthase